MKEQYARKNLHFAPFGGQKHGRCAVIPEHVEAFWLAADFAGASSNMQRPFAEVNAALEALAEGKVHGRTVLTF